jgi:hypothetical protein
VNRERIVQVVTDGIANTRRFPADVGAAIIVQLLEDCQPDHFVHFDADGWFVEHSMACRLDGTLGTCNWGKAIRSFAPEPDPEWYGRWRIDEVDSEGMPGLVRA